MSRLRRWLLALLVVGTLPILAAVWLLGSGSGRDWTLARVVAQLPDGALSIGAAEGRLAGPLVLRDVTYRADGTRVQIDTLRLDHSIARLVGGRLHINALLIDRLHITLDPPPAENEPARIVIPERLPWPQIALPINVSVTTLTVEQLDVVQAADVVLPATKFVLADLDFSDGRFSLGSATVTNHQGALKLDGSAVFSGEPEADLNAVLILAGQQTPAGTLHLRGANGDLSAALALADAGDVSMHINAAMDWKLRADLAVAGSSRWFAEPPFQQARVNLEASGDSIQAALEAAVDVDGRRLNIEDARLSLIDDGGALSIDAFQLIASVAELSAPLTAQQGSPAPPRIAHGTVDIHGRIDFSESLSLKLEAAIDALQLPVGTAGEQAVLTGLLRVSGPPDALDVALSNAHLQRGAITADVEIAGELLAAGFRFDTLDVQTESGGLSASGQVGWQPELSADIKASLRDFDPSMLLADLPGSISGDLSLVAVDDSQSPQLSIQIESLSGTLRERALSGQGSLVLKDARSEADISVVLGGSRLMVKGDPGEQLDLAIALSPLNLADVLPAAKGEIVADVNVSGSRAAAKLVGVVSGSDIATEFGSAARVALNVDAAVDPGGAAEGQITIQAQALDFAGIVIDSLDAALRGDRASHRLSLTALSERADLTLQLSGALSDSAWSGELATLDLALGESEALRLKAPASVRWQAGQLSLEETCLLGARTAELCVSAKGEAGNQSLSGKLRELDLEGLAVALGVESLRFEGRAEGELSVTRRAGGDPHGEVALRLLKGSIAQSDLVERHLLTWDAVQLTGELDEASLTLKLGGKLEETGSISGELTGANPFASPDAAIVGRLALSLPDISALELVISDAANIKGEAAANLELRGTWQSPEIAGSFEVSALAAEVPALGIRVRDSMLSVRGDGQALELDGLLDTGSGTLRIEGSINDVLEDARTGRLRLSGEAVRVANTSKVSAIVSPDVTLAYAKKILRVTGKVVVPEAAIALDEIDGTVSASPDVVVLDPRNGEAAAGKIDLRARIEVILGEKVTLKGFGFDGGVDGTLKVNERSGRASTGRGTLNVRGTYKAYGQDLEIVRGRLLFAASPLDDPGIEVRAQRKVKEVTVGIAVVGSAQLPELSVWSDPALDQAEALSYLVLGRPLRSASAAEGAQLGQAAAAFGGNYLAKRVGSRLGFDTFGVADSQSLGGAAFTVGKFLSPALYLSYGVSLFGSGQVVTLRYLLSEKFDIEIESADESRAGLNYRIER